MSSTEPATPAVTWSVVSQQDGTSPNVAGINVPSKKITFLVNGSTSGFVWIPLTDYTNLALVKSTIDAAAQQVAAVNSLSGG